MVDTEKIKENVGKKAATLITDDSIVGLGTGSTTHYFIKHLGKRIKEEQLEIQGIPTSYQSLILARKAQIKTTTLDEHDVDIAVDGADEVDTFYNLIKGGGAAHTMEKLVDGNAKKFIVIVDESKVVGSIGSFPVPVEIIPDSRRLVEKRIKSLGANPELRMGIKKDGPVITDNGNFILDCKFKEIDSPQELEYTINLIRGVVENGIFSNMADKVLVGKEDSIEEHDNDSKKNRWEVL